MIKYYADLRFAVLNLLHYHKQRSR